MHVSVVRRKKEERCLNPLGHRRAIIWYRGRRSNSTAPNRRRGAVLSLEWGRRRPPHFWLWGQDSNLRISWLIASCLTAWLPHKNWSGTSDSNRDSLGPRPSGLNRFPSPRFQIWSERLESNQRPRASETRALIQLSYAHALAQAAGILANAQNGAYSLCACRHFFVRTEVFYPLNDARIIGVTGGN